MSDLQRSWVSGRGGLTAFISITMDWASGCPIQIGRSRSPCFSLRITTYELEELSSPNRSTRTSIIPRSRAPRRGASGAHIPRRKILPLLGGQLVDLCSHGFELQSRDLAIDRLRNAVHVLGERARIVH